MIRLQEPKCNIRAEFKTQKREYIPMKRKHQTKRWELAAQTNKKRVQEKLTRFAAVLLAAGWPGLVRRSERSSGCPHQSS